MPEPEKTDNVENPAKVDQIATEQKPEHMIPKSKYDEVNEKRKNLETRLAEMEKANKEAEEKRLIEKEDFKKLYEDTRRELESLRPKAAVAEESERTLRAVLDAQVSDLPESVRDMVPEGTTSYKLEWLAKHKAKLIKPAPYDIGAGRTGGGAPDMVTLTPEKIQTAKNFGVKPEEYAKYDY